MSNQLEQVMLPEEQVDIGVSKLNDDEREALKKWGLRMFTLGQHATGEIEEIKFGGRLVILDDGSRWEADELDEDVAAGWLEGDRVVVIEDEMILLDETRKISVEPYFD